MGGMWMDLRVALRSLRRRPSFTGVAVATLALGIGASTLLFAVVNGVLLVPLPYFAPGELVTVYQTNDGWRSSANEALRRAWDVQTTTLTRVEAWRSAPGPITGVTGYTYHTLPLRVGQEGDEPVEAILVDRETFTVLGVAPTLGRVPSADEIQAGAPVAVLRHETWMSRFGGDPAVVGRTFHLGDAAYTVIGVMPPGFFFPTERGGDLWVPVTREARSWPSFYALARLAPGASVEDADVFLDRVARRLGEEDPGEAGLGARAVPHLDNIVGNVKGGIELLFCTALLLVLVACVNLGNLFLGRAATRRQELAVRAALGAGTGRLTAAMLAEVVVIGVVGGGLGIVTAAVTVHPFVHALGVSMRGLPRQGAVGLDLTVLLFSLGATVGTTLLAALAPAVGAAGRAPAAGITSGHRAGTAEATRRSQRLLLSVQAALTVALVSAAVLLARSFLETLRVDLGIKPERVIVLQLRADRERFESVAAVGTVAEPVRVRLSALPGVSSASLTTSLPGQGGVLLEGVRPEGAPRERAATVMTVSVAEDYFATMGIPVLGGREVRGEGEAVVSESLAVQLFGRRDVVGQRLQVGSGDDAHPVDIVGVAAEARQLSAFQKPGPTLYGFVAGRGSFGFYVILATDGDRTAVENLAVQAAAAVDPRIRVTEAYTLRRMLRDGTRHMRMRMWLMTSLAALAALLAMIGISGVVAHFLSEQTHDVGIRMALGAAGRREVGRVVSHALRPTAVGLSVGVVVSVLSSRVMESFVFGVDPSDPATYAVAVTLLLGAAALAAWLPARRAAAIDPARVLSRDG